MTDDGPDERDGGGGEDPADAVPVDVEPADGEPTDVEPADGGPLRELHLEVGLRPITDLLGSLVDIGVGGGSPPPRDAVDWTTVEERRGDRKRGGTTSARDRSRRVGETGDGEYLLDTRFDGDEFVVTADLPGASRDDLTVGIDPDENALVIKRDGTELERIALPWESVEAERVLFNNGVLEARMRPAEY